MSAAPAVSKFGQPGRGVVRTLGYHEFLAQRRFAAFDGVRAIAAIMVIAFHFAGPRFAFLSGWLGVQLFFVLSGFLITTLLLREEKLAGRVSLSNFWIRRIFRIVPNYYLIVLASVIILVLNGEWTSAGGTRSIGWFLAVSPELAPTSLGFTPAWTIGIEQKFYVVWPLLAFVISANFARRRAIVWLATLVTVLALTIAYSSYFVHFVVILMGCGLAIALNSPRGFRALRWLTTPIAGLVAIAALLAVQLSAVSVQHLFNSQVQLILVYGLCAAAAVPSLCASTGAAGVLSTRPLRWLGDRSYSIYLVQGVAGAMVSGVFRGSPGLHFFAIELVVVIVLADAMHRWLELPSIRFGKRWIDRRAIRGSEASARALILGAQPEGGLPRGEV
jgi:peptidoglycan/LPS O-acetylase OafA/YrhL